MLRYPTFFKTLRSHTASGEHLDHGSVQRTGASAAALTSSAPPEATTVAALTSRAATGVLVSGLLESGARPTYASGVRRGPLESGFASPDSHMRPDGLYAEYAVFTLDGVATCASPGGRIVW
jgi:hypothetical protein